MIIDTLDNLGKYESQMMLDTWIQQDMKSLDFSIIRINLAFLLFVFALFNQLI